MTPTLAGRLQTRVLLMVLLGLPITVPFWVLSLFVPVPFVFWLVTLLVGMAFDPLYHLIQQRRWDHDWPVHFLLYTGLVEGLVASAVLAVGSLLVGTLSLVLFAPLAGLILTNIVLFPLNYFFIWAAVSLFSLGPIQIFSLRWRFRGGELARARIRPRRRRGRRRGRDQADV